MVVNIISDTIQEFNGERFYLCGLYFQHKGRRLHRLVWEHHSGPIPTGSHVHHRDGNRANNDISNLDMMVDFDHLSGHGSTEEARIRSRRSLLESARPKAAEWHRSDAGKELGRKAYSIVKDQWLAPVELICKVCGSPYSTVSSRRNESRFCSNNCKSAARRKSGADNITKTCPACAMLFETDRYQASECCSKKCAWRMRRARKQC